MRACSIAPSTAHRRWPPRARRRPCASVPRMRLRRGAATAALFAALGATAPARAQRSVDWRASVTLTGAYTQTISDAPYPTSATFAGPILGLSPSLVALIDTLRTENTLSYGFALSIPFSRQLGDTTVPVSYSN